MSFIGFIKRQFHRDPVMLFTPFMAVAGYLTSSIIRHNFNVVNFLMAFMFFIVALGFLPNLIVYLILKKKGKI